MTDAIDAVTVNPRAFVGRPLVYIAGPYSGDPLGNTRAAVTTAENLQRTWAVTCVVPHLSLLWDLLVPHGPLWWYAYDLAILARCDALWRMDGESDGTDREVDFAVERGMPVFTGAMALRHERFRRWVQEWGE